MNTIAQVVTSNEKVNARLLQENETLKYQNNKLICEIENLLKNINRYGGVEGGPLLRATENAQALIETMV